MTTSSPVASFDYEAQRVRVVFGPGRLVETDRETDSLGFARVMVIADEHVPGAAQLCAVLGGRLAVRWEEVVQHVPIELADRACKAALAENVDGVVTLGGGSATGLAKAVALESGLPILAIPTTYAGSELTPVFGLTGERHKRTGTDERVRPRTVLYDPELTIDLPSSITGPSAFNALAHCFAALWSPRRDPLTCALAVEAIRTVVASLPVLAGDPRDLRARSGLQYAAFLAGTALGRSGTGLQHTICHVLGGRLNLSHADTHSVVLPHVVALNAAAGPDWVERLLPVLGDQPGRSLWQLARESGLATGLARLGAGRDDLQAVAEEVAGSANPVPATSEVVEALLGRALDDEPPVPEG